MDNYRAFLAILISFIILFGYQYFFVGFPTEETVVEGQDVEQQTMAGTPQQDVQTPPQSLSPAPPSQPVMEERDAKKITVDTPLYTAVFSEAGGVAESFVLKSHTETNDDNSPGKAMVRSSKEQGYPLKFAWGSVIPAETYYQTKTDSVTFSNGKGELQMSAFTPSGLEIEKSFVFYEDSYLIDLNIRVKNSTQQSLQGNPQLFQVNVPFQEKSD